MLDILADVERRRQDNKCKFDLPVPVNKEEPVIRKVAPEPTGLASFDEDLEEEIDVTHLKD